MCAVMKTLYLLLCLACPIWADAMPRQVRVFIALCDNKTQGIVPVGQKIGNGDDPDANLYWGCSDGFGTFFRQSKSWKVVSTEKDVSAKILRRMTVRHVAGDVEVVASAYRGAEMRQCLIDFEAAACSNQWDAVAFIGHNGLMDFALEAPKMTEGNDTDVMVLCCKSETYFGDRLRAAGCKPVLMTQQLMYPGAFLLDAALEKWRTGGSPADLRAAAAAAYARNQKISVKAAMGVFAPAVAAKNR
jgi:hypothetical protein